MQTSNYRLQSSTPTSSVATSTVTVYADASGVLRTLDASATVDYKVGQVYQETRPTHTVPRVAAGGNLATGTFGASGTLLGTPTLWVRVIGPDNSGYALPLYHLG